MSDNNFTFDNKKRVTLGIGVTILISAIIFYSVILNWKIECEHPERLITIPKGSSAVAVAKILQQELCLQNQGIFKLALTITMNNRTILPGRYNLKGISTIGQLVGMITSPSAERIKVTLVEGWSVEQFADELKQKLQINSLKFIRLSKDDDLLNSFDPYSSLLF